MRQKTTENKQVIRKHTRFTHTGHGDRFKDFFCFPNMEIFIPFQNLCKELHSKIDLADEERYDCEHKVIKHNKDVSDRIGDQPY